VRLKVHRQRLGLILEADTGTDPPVAANSPRAARSDAAEDAAQ